MKPSIGRIVIFVPPQACVGPESLDRYPALITKVNEDESVELTTFGPNSLYYQHSVKHSEGPESGCWHWPPRVN
jgi:hypothetical protein